MKFNFEHLDEAISVSHMTTLVIEDVKVFSNVVEMLYRYNDESKLKIFDKKLILPSEIEIVTDILGYDINTPTLLRTIYSNLEKQLNEKLEIRSIFENLTLELGDLIEEEFIDYDLDLEIDEVSVPQIFKLYGVRVEVENRTIFEKITEIIKVFKHQIKKKLLIFINVCSYLNTKEIVQLREYISLYNLNVLFLEPKKTYGINQYILDKDYYLYCKNAII